MPGGPLLESVTLAEREFALDVIGAIDFTLRNGVSFAFIINMLAHDLGEIFSRGSLDKALSDQILPKCSGYSQFTQAAVADPDTSED